MTHIYARAHAKINLYLSVAPPHTTGKLAGYHPLHTIFHSLNLYDELTLTIDSTASQLSNLTITPGKTCLDPAHIAAVPCDTSNLAWRSIEMYCDALKNTDIDLSSIRLNIEKNIPVAGGMAGGSADAAAALILIHEWAKRQQQQLSPEQLMNLAAQLGSDVPYTVCGGTCIGTGRGEQLTPIPGAHATLHWVVATQKYGLSTPEVFRAFDALPPDDTINHKQRIAELTSALSADHTTPKAIAPLLYNALQKAALHLRPELKQTLVEGRAAGALTSMISGSGPTTLFLANDAEHAHTIAAHIRSTHTAHMCITAHSVHGGAYIITPQNFPQNNGESNG